MTDPTPEQVLACPMPANDAGAATVREYLVELLGQLWTDKDEFSGKRPFGNSGWKYEVYEALVDAGLIEGSRDEDGFLEECDGEEGDRLVRKAIGAL